MRPVDDKFPVSQEFGSDATAGVSADPNGTEVQQLVAAYGNYQPYGHAGQDIACPVGTQVHAIADGTVIWADWGTNLPGDDSDLGYRQRWYMYKNFPGIVTLIQHAGWISMYGHLSNNDAAPVGTRVKEGDLIGLSGNTKAPGVTLGAHLHVGALVDLSYRCSGGLIYGCTDPTPYYGSGSINVQGAITTTTEEDDMFTDADRALLQATLNKADGGQLRADLGYQNDTYLSKAFTKADGAWQNGLLADISARLGRTLDKADGGYIVGLLEAVKPGATDAAAIAEAVVSAVGKDVAAEVVKSLGEKLGAA